MTVVNCLGNCKHKCSCFVIITYFLNIVTCKSISLILRISNSNLLILKGNLSNTE
jgi:hypothetical protein